MLENVNDEEFQQKIKSDKIIIVFFCSPTCAPCKSMGPVMVDLANEYNDDLVILKANVTQAQSVAQNYSISHLPTFLIFKDGIVASALYGPQKKETFEDILSEWFD